MKRSGPAPQAGAAGLAGRIGLLLGALWGPRREAPSHGLRVWCPGSHVRTSRLWCPHLWKTKKNVLFCFAYYFLWSPVGNR